MYPRSITILIAVAVILLLRSSPADAFGVDVCYNAPDSGLALIRNCIDLEESCRTSNLSPERQLACRVAATTDSLSGLSGGNSIIGGRSLLHSDSTYLMAQLIGFTPWQAYQVMIYNEATDQSEYFPFDENGRQMLSDEEIAGCRADWGRAMPRYCRVITPVMNGVYKFNDEAGGMLLHLHARFSPAGEPPPAIGFPADYFSSANARYELLVNNLRDWAFDRRRDACVAGILAHNQAGARVTAPCEVRDRVIKSPQSFFAAGVTRLQIPFSSKLGTLVVHEDERGTVLASDRSFHNYIAPHEVSFAKLGVFLHSLADRISHHECTDRSWFYRTASGDYDSSYDQITCAQGNHFLWHAWEQGTDQHDDNLQTRSQTLRPALDAVYDQLLDNAWLRRLPVNPDLNKQAIVNRLVTVLGTSDPLSRLNAMVALMEEYHALPLPGHGSAAELTLEQWLDAAGAPGQ
jgi:hypothetical protein